MAFYREAQGKPQGKMGEKRGNLPRNHSILHVDSAVCECGKALVVGDDDERLAKAVAKVEEELVELGLVFGVEATRRLIGQDDIGMINQRTGHCHTLLLSS